MREEEHTQAENRTNHVIPARNPRRALNIHRMYGEQDSGQERYRISP